jgi:hypothetical protein
VVCAHCGAIAPVITIPRDSVSFASRIPGALAYPLSVHGLLAMAGLGAPAGILYFLYRYLHIAPKSNQTI